jgi:phosphate uptake regulator
MLKNKIKNRKDLKAAMFNAKNQEVRIELQQNYASLQREIKQYVMQDKSEWVENLAKKPRRQMMLTICAKSTKSPEPYRRRNQ